MNSLSAPAVFVLPHYDVHGRIAAMNTRALDALNDQTTRYLKLESVRFCAPGEMDPLMELASSIVTKNLLQAVLLLDEDRSTESKVYFASLARKTFDIVLTLPTMIVEGRIHSKAGGDLQAFLGLEAAAFFPVTAATIRSRQRRQSAQEYPVVLVNKERVSSMSALAT